ncbi:hypothetical protein LZ30DRAFT_433635 [Colletotrichum cereale]|nr:hypothetical protein LZ30DRAFT_433635 [Colletotrichum cereale]
MPSGTRRRVAILAVLPSHEFDMNYTADLRDLVDKSVTVVMAFDIDKDGRPTPITTNSIRDAANGIYLKVGVWMFEQNDEGKTTPVSLSLNRETHFKWDTELVTLLLNKLGMEVEAKEDIVKAAAKNVSSGEMVMKILLDRWGDKVRITEEIAKAAVGNSYEGLLLMRLLLKERGKEFRVTEEIVVAAIGNRYEGLQLIRLLLKERGKEFRITEKIVKAASGNRASVGMMKLLLKERGEEVRAIQNIIEATAEDGNVARPQID